MAFPITLNPPNVCLISATSPSGFIPDSQEDIFGSVYKINSDTQNFSTGDVVLFSRTKAILVNQLSQTYFIVSEKEIKFTDDYVAP